MFLFYCNNGIAQNLERLYNIGKTTLILLELSFKINSRLLKKYLTS